MKMQVKFKGSKLGKHTHTHPHMHIIPVPYSIIHAKLFDRSPCAYTASVGGIMSVPVVVKVQIKLIRGLA